MNMFVLNGTAGSRFPDLKTWSFFLLFVLSPLFGEGEDIPEVEVKVFGEGFEEDIPSLEDVDLERTSSVYSKIDVSSKKNNGQFLVS